MPDTALVILARYPEPGKTKTRLARSLGNVEVANLYRAFLTDLAQRFTDYNSVALHWAYTPTEVDYQALIATLVPAGAQYMSYFPQQGLDLGTRLLHAFQWTHQHDFQRTILIGSDSPQISRGIIDAAQIALDEADVVLGPAEDGGYYLIAMHKPYDVFSAIPMSTPEVLNLTVAAAERQGLRVKQLAPLFDVDELPELLRLARLLEADSALAPATAAQLTTMRNLI